PHSQIDRTRSHCHPTTDFATRGRPVCFTGLPAGAGSAIYQELQRCGIPTVVLGHSAPFCSQFVNVETDDLPASHAATQHLLELGHKRIAFFAGPQVSPWAHERLDGYRRALREANIEVDDTLVFNAGSTVEEGA